jgi:uncharacterized short protein YbdD (DUF466 family)
MKRKIYKHEFNPKCKEIKMSIAKLLGIPRTFDEFVAKVKRRGDNQVDVTLEAYDDERGYGYHCVVGVQAGKTKLRLNEHTHWRLGHLYHTVIEIAKVEQASLREAIETAEKLKNLGLEATIKGGSVDKAWEGIAQYDRGIEEMRQKYRAYL